MHLYHLIQTRRLNKAKNKKVVTSQAFKTVGLLNDTVHVLVHVLVFEN